MAPLLIQFLDGAGKDHVVVVRVPWEALSLSNQM